jgi:hypothetical protein
MKSLVLKVFCLLFVLGYTGSALAVGQAGDSRLQANGSLILAEQGDDTTIIIAQFQSYRTDTLLLGAYLANFDSGGFASSTIGITVKNTFPSGSDSVPYVGAAGLLLSNDFDDEFVYSVNAGVDIYVEENFGYNFDVTQGLTSDEYEDTTLSFGGFYEF